MAGSVLLVSARSHASEQIARALRRKGYAAAVAAHVDPSPDDTAPEVAMVDIDLPDGGVDTIRRLAERWPSTPILAVADTATLESAVNPMRAGAYDYMARPLRIQGVVIALERALEHRRLQREVVRLRKAVRSQLADGELIGTSQAMRQVDAMLERIAPSDAPVLLCGETGTGKEVAARLLHARSGRKGAYVALNCAAVPEPLLESELFGHVKGAFTDARADRPGLFVRARGGTLFLDEIGDLPLSLQPKLLRALQTRTVRPVGSDAEVAFDARLVSATNRDLEIAVEDARFRRDLFFRINVIQIEVPPLRSRGSDVLQLARHFLDRACARSGKDVRGLSAEAARRLLEYRWPGNVRELENCVEHAVALNRSGEIEPDDLPPRIRDFKPSHVLVAADDPSELVAMEVVEERYVRRVLSAVGGNKAQAARVLGFDRKTLYRKLQRYGIETPPARGPGEG